ncbi:hypothetical protein ACFVQF_17535 [Streptomyces sp. NPDC057866]|uniref:hypothetical protein n=1 Tax=Streptomyces sp. NPDC057866 TaxID=3346268 RepID=UPI0004C2CE39
MLSAGPAMAPARAPHLPSKTFGLAAHTVVRGTLRYRRGQYGDRVMSVRADGVILRSAATMHRVAHGARDRSEPARGS